MEAINLPDGIVFNRKGPMKASRHDITLYRMSSIEDALTNGVWYGFRWSPVQYFRGPGVLYESVPHRFVCFREFFILPWRFNASIAC